MITVERNDFGKEIHDMYNIPINGDLWPIHFFITQSQAACRTKIYCADQVHLSIKSELRILFKQQDEDEAKLQKAIILACEKASKNGGKGKKTYISEDSSEQSDDSGECEFLHKADHRSKADRVADDRRYKMTSLEKFCKALPTCHLLTFHLMANMHEENKPKKRYNHCPMGKMLSPWRIKHK